MLIGTLACLCLRLLFVAVLFIAAPQPAQPAWYYKEGCGSFLGAVSRDESNKPILDNIYVQLSLPLRALPRLQASSRARSRIPIPRISVHHPFHLTTLLGDKAAVWFAKP